MIGQTLWLWKVSALGKDAVGKDESTAIGCLRTNMRERGGHGSRDRGIPSEDPLHPEGGGWGRPMT